MYFCGSYIFTTFSISYPPIVISLASFTVKDYCKANKIDYSKCVEYKDRGIHYFEDIGLL